MPDERRWTLWFDHPKHGRVILANDLRLDQMGFLGHWANLEREPEQTGYPYGLHTIEKP